MNGHIQALGGTEGSRAWFDRAQASLAGGISSSSRLTSTGPHPYPLYMASGSGTRIRDVDGNDYIDYLISYGSAVLGHAPPQLTEALTAVLHTGTMFGTCNTPEVELAELIRDMVPCAELVRFANSGSEAVQGRCAPPAGTPDTRRSSSSKATTTAGPTHSPSPTAPVPPRPPLRRAPPRAPLPRHTRRGRRRRRRLPVERSRGSPHGPRRPPRELAAVICEPIVANNACTMPDPGYLDLLRDECTAREIVLIFDEVCTGFRTGPGGAQTMFDVTPDIAVFSKALGGGLPIAAFAGQRHVMEPLARGLVKHGGTYNSSPLCATSALVTLRGLNRPETTERIDDSGRRIMETIRRAAHDRRIPCAVQGVGAMFQTVFTPDGAPTRQYRDLLHADQARYHAFRHELLKRGVHANAYGMACWFVAATVTEDELAITCEAVEEAFAAL